MKSDYTCCYLSPTDILPDSVKTRGKAEEPCYSLKTRSKQNALYYLYSSEYSLKSLAEKNIKLKMDQARESILSLLRNNTVYYLENP